MVPRYRTLNAAIIIFMLGEFKLVANMPLSFQEVLARTKYVALDFELTGLDKDNDRIIDIGFVFLDENFQVLATYETLLDPERDTGPVHIHHITNEMVAGKPKFADVAEEVAEMIDGKILVGFNNGLDFSCLDREFKASNYAFRARTSLDLSPIRSDPRFYETPKYEKVLLAVMESQSVQHRALPDAMEAALLLPAIVEFAVEHPTRVPKAYQPSLVERLPIAVGE